MAIELISTVFSMNIKPASVKFTLVALANCADSASNECFPSIKYLSVVTSQDRKTILDNIKKLKDIGILQDTGKRRGETGQVIVYKLNLNVEFNSTENGMVKQSQKRNSTENGTVPNFPDNSPVFPMKQSQISHETVPKTGHGNVRNVNETSLKRNKENKTQKPAFVLPDWFSEVDKKNWAAWNSTAKRKKATIAQLEASIEQLSEWRNQGIDWSRALKNSAVGGWQGLFEPKARASPTKPTNGLHDLSKPRDYAAGINPDGSF